MRRLVGRWLVTAVPLVFAVSILTFVLVSLMPGDPARSIVGLNGTEEQYERLRSELGLDHSLPQQYGGWLSGAVRGDFGHSISNGDAVSHQLGVRLPVTLALIVGGVVVAVVVGVSLGVAGALRHGPVGRAADTVALLGAAVPAYWLGLLLAYFFAVRWQLLPATGFTPFAESPAEWFRSLVLPVLTLGLASSAPIAKQTRNGVLAELDKDYVTVLRARGLRTRTIVFKHVLRNAAAPVLTVVGLTVIGLLTGTVLVERIFVLPGLGQMAVNSTLAHDIPSVQAVTVVFTLVIVLVNLLVELAYAALDPKVR